MKKVNYTKIEDFINDESFINWATESTLSDIEFWDDFIEKNENLSEIIYDAKAILIGPKFSKQFVSEEKINNAWSKFENRINNLETKSVNKKSKLFSFNNKTAFSIAASIVLIFTIFSVYLAKRPTTITHKTSFGEVLTIKLPDGTIVTLNSNSILKYKENNSRDVVLQGEAFFKVIKKPTTNAKFWVNTKDLQVAVYGTSFNVSNRSTKTQVFLEEGSIALKLKNGREKKMTPGDLISYSYSENSIIEEKTSLRPELQTSWKDGSLIFDRATLESAMYKIKNTYGLDVVFENETSKDILLTGAVPTQNIDICIKTIEKTAQVTIVNKNNKLHIYKN